MVELALVIALVLSTGGFIWFYREVSRDNRRSYEKLHEDAVARFERTTRDRDGMLIEFLNHIVDKIQTPDEATKQMLAAIAEPAAFEKDPLTALDEQWLEQPESEIGMGDDLSPTLDAEEQ